MSTHGAGAPSAHLRGPGAPTRTWRLGTLHREVFQSAWFRERRETSKGKICAFSQETAGNGSHTGAGTSRWRFRESSPRTRLCQAHPCGHSPKLPETPLSVHSHSLTMTRAPSPSSGSLLRGVRPRCCQPPHGQCPRVSGGLAPAANSAAVRPCGVSICQVGLSGGRAEVPSTRVGSCRGHGTFVMRTGHEGPAHGHLEALS